MCIRDRSLRPDRVILNIPKTYRREAYRDDSLPVVPAGVEVLVSDVDYGPATKLLPTLRAFAGQEVNIAFCDDDRLYPNNWLSTLVENAKRHPHDLSLIHI